MTYSVYVFLDKKNRPYYVGKTNNMARRLKEHKEEILRGNSLPKYNVARKLMSNGTPFKMKAIRKTKTEKEAYRVERYFIKKYRKDGYALMNCTYGGPKEIRMQINKPKKIKQTGISIPALKPKKKKKPKIPLHATIKRLKKISKLRKRK